MGPRSGPPGRAGVTRRATAAPGRDERMGGMGAMSGPPFRRDGPMSGHSRWSQIKRKKGKADVQRGKLFSKILREITVAARNGGGDPKVNMRLKAAMESAKAANMPAENVKRAVQKGTGELPGESYEEITYEGYAAGGVAVMVRVLTDNRNRTAPELRHTFEKYGGPIGAPRAVAGAFRRK